MRSRSRTRRFGRAAGGGLLVLLALSGAAIAAEDEDEDTFEQRIIKNIMRGFGAQVDRAGIDYRERSPLVIPPTRDLPPPETTSGVNSPAWPNDPDQRKPTPKAEKFESGSIRTHNIEKATLSPTELRKGALPAGSNQVAKPGSTDNRDPGRSLSPSELGYTGGLFNSLLPGGAKTEAEPFTGEPPRTSLTQPPTGYQTPSASYPYGINSEKKNNSTLNLPLVKDRAAADPTQ